MRNAMRAVLRALPTLCTDLAGLTGAVLIAGGAWLIFHPAGVIVLGAELLGGALLINREADIPSAESDRR